MTETIEEMPGARPLSKIDAKSAAARERLRAWRAEGLDTEQMQARLALKHCACTHTPGSSHRGATGKGACLSPGCDCKRYRRDPIDAMIEKALRGAERTFRQDAHEYDRRTNPNAKRHAAPKQAGVWHVGPSDRSTCRKAIEYRERPPEGYTPAPTDKQAAHMGTIVHEGFRRRRKALYPWRKFEQSVTVPGLDRPGRYDEYDAVLARLVDAKTAGDWKWDHVGKYGPPTEEIEQAMIYAYAMNALGFPVEEVEIVYINRGTGADESFLFPYDESVAMRGLTWLRQVLDALDLGEELPRDRTGPSTDPICARYCPARRHCWNVPEAEDRGVSPEHATLIHNDPDIEFQLEAYDRAREEEAEAKARKEQAKALLDGADLGQYGSMIYSKTGGRLLDPVLDLEARIAQLEQFYELPVEERPPLADIRPPMKIERSRVSISVKRERASKRLTKAQAAQDALDGTKVGSDPTRAAVGKPGHCDRCAEFGHRRAHLALDCAEVGCDGDHEVAAP